uniref:Uncharacterized protein n=1 Tax=Arundo donax TaxID=35708 RepID=A0A0A9C738_ARUDO
MMYADILHSFVIPCKRSNVLHVFLNSFHFIVYVLY